MFTVMLNGEGVCSNRFLASAFPPPAKAGGNKIAYLHSLTFICKQIA